MKIRVVARVVYPPHNICYATFYKKIGNTPVLQFFRIIIIYLSGRPVHNLEISDTLKFSDIVRYKGNTETQGMRTDQCVQRANRLANLLKL